MVDRRSFLRGLGSLPLVGGATAPTADPDPMIALRREWLALRRRVETAPTETERDDVFRRWCALERLAPCTPALTTAGAIAAIEWVQDEIEEHGDGDPGDRLQMALLTSVLGLLRRFAPTPLGRAA